MTVTWYYYTNENTQNTSVNATNRLVSDQSGVLGVWPCHCSLSAVGKPSNPSDSHSLQACKQQSKAEKELSTLEKTSWILTGGIWSWGSKIVKNQMKIHPSYPNGSN